MSRETTIILFYAVMMFIFILPMFFSQRKKRRKQLEMINSLKIGDKVITIGGLKGTISSIQDQTVELTVDKSTKLTFLKSAVSTVE